MLKNLETSSSGWWKAGMRDISVIDKIASEDMHNDKDVTEDFSEEFSVGRFVVI